MRMPGACVPVSNQRLTLRRTIIQSSPPDPDSSGIIEDQIGYETLRVHDLDGDGAVDVYQPTPRGSDCAEDMHLAVYIMRGACGHYVGTVVGRVQRPQPAQRTLPDLTATELETISGNPTQERTHTRTYHFNGVRYVQTQHTQSDAVCHHCATESCVALTR